MNVKYFFPFFIFMLGTQVGAQDVSALPIIASPVSDTSKPLIMYLSGDGGANSFSTNLVKALNSNNYPVVMLNSLKYFWVKKTPVQTASDVEKIIRHYQGAWKRKDVVIVGYSFGADVSPFVFNRLQKDLQALVKSIVLLSPSRNTDFEVHVTGIFGTDQSNASNVTDQISRIKVKPLIILRGQDESDQIDFSKLQNKNYKVFTLKGGHRYNYNTAEVAGTIVSNL